LSFCTNLNASKGYIIFDMFVRPADEDYVTARWCHNNQLVFNFYWNALQALEKYMKAVLLFNGKTAQNYGHNLQKLFCDVHIVAGFLLPNILTKPHGLSVNKWEDQQPLEFLKLIEDFGAPDNRYRMNRFVQEPYHLHMLDSMVWALRRIAFRLDKTIDESVSESTAGTIREFLTENPSQTLPREAPLDQLLLAENSEKRRAFLNLNAAFAPANSEHTAIGGANAFHNSPLFLRIFSPLASQELEIAKVAYAAANWLLANTKCSKQLRCDITKAMEKAKSIHPSIDVSG
jgi:hypothetical protein